MSDVPINDDIVLLGDATYLKEDESGEIIIDPYPTQGSQNAVQSGGTFEVIDGINYVLGNAHLRSLTNQRHLQVTNCTNVCEITLVTQVINGVTLTLRDDDTFTVNGTASANIQLKVGIVHCTANDYIYPYFRIIGCPPDSSGSLKVIREGNSSTSTVATDTGEGARFCTYEDESLKKGYIYNLYFACPSGATFSNKRFIPMAYATFYNAGAPDADEEYFYGFKTPFSKSNEDLTREQDRLQMAGYNVQGSDVLAYNQGAFNVQSFSQAGMVPGQPSTYGFMQTMTRGHNTMADSQETHQLWFTQNDGDLYHRGTNYTTYNDPPAFKRILDNSNVANNTHFQYVDIPADPTVASFVSRTVIEAGRFIAFKVRDGNNIFGVGADWYRGFVQYQNITGGVQGYGFVARQNGIAYSFYVGGEGTSSNPYSIAKCAPIMNECPRDGNLYNANLAPQKNTFRYREVTGSRGNQHLPADGWFHLVDSMGTDPDYFCQLAIGMTVSGLWYRRKYGSTYSKWYKCDASWTWMQGGSSTNLYTLNRQDFTELHIHIYKDNNYFTLDVMTEDLHDSTLRFFRVGSGGGNYGGCIMKISRKQIQMHEFYIAATNYTTSASYNVYFK